MQANSVIAFWFNEIEPRQWWVKDAAFDALIERRFGNVLRQAVSGELAHWRNEPKGRLAEIIVLDQFSRNIYRDTAAAFAADPQALALAQEALRLGLDEPLSGDERLFLVMPLMHSESAEVHKQAEAVFESLAAYDERFARNLEFERRHKMIVDRFGRYPHRNKLLGRRSTAEELEFLQQPGSGF